MVLDEFKWRGYALNARNNYKVTGADLATLQKFLDICYHGTIKVNPQTPQHLLDVNIVELQKGVETTVIPLWDLITNHLAYILYSNNWRKIKGTRDYLATMGDYNMIDNLVTFYIRYKRKWDPNYQF